MYEIIGFIGFVFFAYASYTESERSDERSIALAGISVLCLLVAAVGS